MPGTKTGLFTPTRSLALELLTSRYIKEAIINRLFYETLEEFRYPLNIRH